MDSNTPCVSFIGIVDFSEQARWVFLSESVSDLLGFEPHELVGTPSLDLVHPDEFSSVKKLHYDTISQDKAAVLAYLRLRHKDPFKGFILCAISRTVAYNVLVGSVSFASMGPKAMHNASTAQEVTIITPSARNFEFRRWGDPSPMHPSAITDSEDEGSGTETETEEPTSLSSFSPKHLADSQIPRRTRKELSPDSPTSRTAGPSDSASRSPRNDREPASPPRKSSTDNSSTTREKTPSSPGSPRLQRDVSPARTSSESPRSTTESESDVISFDPLPKQSVRTALFLDRFSSDCKIEYCSNDNFVQTTEVMGRPFFDFVIKKDEELVRSWIDAIKAWGVNERGQPSDGGFGYGKFTLYLPGRDSREREPEGTRGRHRRGSRGASLPGRQERQPSSHSAAPKSSSSRPRPRGRTRDEMRVDAIFSAHSDGLMVIIRHASKY